VGHDKGKAHCQMLLISIITSAASLLARPPKVTYRSAGFTRTMDRCLEQIGLAKTSDHFNVALIVRIPILVVAVYQQIFARPSPPYMLDSAPHRALLSRHRAGHGVVSVIQDVSTGSRWLYQDSLTIGGAARWESKRNVLLEP
jgi:hypothetical protein